MHRAAGLGFVFLLVIACDARAPAPADDARAAEPDGSEMSPEELGAMEAFLRRPDLISYRLVHQGGDVREGDCEFLWAFEVPVACRIGIEAADRPDEGVFDLPGATSRAQSVGVSERWFQRWFVTVPADSTVFFSLHIRRYTPERVLDLLNRVGGAAARDAAVAASPGLSGSAGFAEWSGVLWVGQERADETRAIVRTVPELSARASSLTSSVMESGPLFETPNQLLFYFGPPFDPDTPRSAMETPAWVVRAQIRR